VNGSGSFVLTVAVTLLVLLYIRYAFLARINHDEVEHAHVAFPHSLGRAALPRLLPESLAGLLAGGHPVCADFPSRSRPFSPAGLSASCGCWAAGGSACVGLAQIRVAARSCRYWFTQPEFFVLAYDFEFHLARPDPLMVFFSTAGLCLIPTRGALGNARALGPGDSIRLAFSLSSKVMPLALVVPLLVTLQGLRASSLRPLIAVVSFAARNFAGCASNRAVACALRPI